jgi:hypothetical protein
MFAMRTCTVFSGWRNAASVSQGLGGVRDVTRFPGFCEPVCRETVVAVVFVIVCSRLSVAVETEETGSYNILPL